MENRKGHQKVIIQAVGRDWSIKVACGLVSSILPSKQVFIENAEK